MVFENLESLDLSKEKIERERPISNLYRSNLMVRGDNKSHLNKLDSLKCDVATINLEDGISDKKLALDLTKIFLSHLKNSYSKIVVRVNEINSGGIEEIKSLNPILPDAFRIPKIRTKEELDEVLYVVDKNIDIYLTIETKEAFLELSTFAKSPRVKVLYLGILDLYADMGLPQSMVSFENETTKYLLTKFATESRLCGAIPISFTYQDYKNIDDFRRWCEISKRIGYGGQGCISPSQVDIANEVFGYELSELERARYIKDIFETNRAKGVTGFSDEKYGFIDEPIYRDALVVLNLKTG